MQIADEIPQQNVFLVLKQIQRLEIQRARLIEKLESETDFMKKISIEKLLFSIDNKISNICEKMTFHSWDVLRKLRPTNHFDFE